MRPPAGIKGECAVEVRTPSFKVTVTGTNRLVSNKVSWLSWLSKGGEEQSLLRTEMTNTDALGTLPLSFWTANS